MAWPRRAGAPPAQRLAAGEAVGERLRQQRGQILPRSDVDRVLVCRSFAGADLRHATIRCSCIRAPAGFLLASVQAGSRVGLQGNRAVEHLERVAVDVAVMKAALLDPAQSLQLGQHRSRRSDVAHQLEAAQHERRGEDAAQLREHALARDPVQPVGVRARRGQRGGLGTEIELDRDPHEAQHTQRIGGEGSRAGHAQAAILQVREPAQRVDRRAA